MSLSPDERDRLSLHSSIITDRGREIDRAVLAKLRVDDLDALADQSLEIIEAAQAIEIMCGRAARRARKEHP